MKKFSSGQRIDTVFVLIIFCIFAVSVLMVLMLGAGIYQNMTDISREEQDERTALSYIRTKIRNNDIHGRIVIDEFGGLPALVYDEHFYDRHFRTSIYHYDGWIREMFADAELEFYPGDGHLVMPLDNITFEELDNGLFLITSGTRRLILSPRTSGARTLSADDIFEEVILE